jgi:hypothetical protein
MTPNTGPTKTSPVASSQATSYSPPAYASPRSAAPTSTAKKKGRSIAGFVAVILLFIGFRSIGPIFNAFTGSSSSSPSSSSSTLVDSDDGDYDEFAEDDTDSYDMDDQFTLGKSWSGTVGAKAIKNYKPVVSDCKSFADEDGADAVRCAVKWTNPYSTTIRFSDRRFPSYELEDGTGEYVDEALVSQDSIYYDEMLSDVSVAAKQGDTVTSYIFFNPTKDDTVWISIETDAITSKDNTKYRETLETTIAKVNVKTLKVTNADWSEATAADDDASSETDSDSESVELAESDDAYSFDDLYTLGKSWSGTVGAKAIKNYKPRVTGCDKFMDSENEAAVRCSINWTNPYSTQITYLSREFPHASFMEKNDITESFGAGGTSPGIAFPGEDGPYYDEYSDALDIVVKPGKSTTTASYFKLDKSPTIWVCFETKLVVERDGKKYLESLETTIAKVDMTTLKVTNADWSK